MTEVIIRVPQYQPGDTDNVAQNTAIAAQFARWNRGGGQVLAGLARRREAERALFEGVA